MVRSVEVEADYVAFMERMLRCAAAGQWAAGKAAHV